MSSATMEQLPGSAPAAVMDEEELELMRNFGENGLMSPVQAILKKQLTERLLKAEADWRTQEEAREAAKVARENLGVELYGLQQQLARITVDLESRAAQATRVQEERIRHEVTLKRFEDGFNVRKQQIVAKEVELEKLKGSLDGISDTIRQVEKYNEEMSAQIALTRRATFKAEEDVVTKEAAKAKQDTYIDHLNTQIKLASEQLQILRSQKGAQTAQIASVLSTIADANSEVDAIAFEKKQLLAQWQSTLVAMKKRDEVVVAQQKRIAEVREQLESMDAEENNLRKATTSSQTAHAKLQETLDKERADLKYLENQAAGLKRQYDALEQKQEDLAQALAATEAEIKRVGVEQARLIKELREVEGQRALLDKARFGIEDEIQEELSEKLANEKAAKALLRDASALVQRMHGLEVSRAEAENAIAAFKVEALTVASRVGQLRDALGALEAGVSDKERLIERYDAEIKQRNDAVQKKMTVVDKLNRQWERMTEGQVEPENMGPLHAEVANLSKQIAEVRNQCEVLQRRWLTEQTALVAATNDAEVKATRLRESQSQAMLLQQKRIRLDGAIAHQQSELRRLDVSIKAMHDDMARITGLISRNSALYERIANVADLSEKQFNEELRDLERECAQADARVAALGDEKSRLFEELLECERQVVLWEKKIALEKETQDALDPSVGAAETAAMEKEIARMRARYEALKRDQERLVAEMQRAIEKREVIAMKHKSARAMTMTAAAALGKGAATAAGATLGSLSGLQKGKAGDALTRIGLQQKASLLRKDISGKMASAQDMQAALEETRSSLQAVSQAADSRIEQVQMLEARAVAIQRDINAALFDKQKAVEHVAALIKLLQRLEALDAGKLPPLTQEEQLHARSRLAEAELARDAVRDVVARLAEMHTDLADVLGRVSQLVEVAPTIS